MSLVTDFFSFFQSNKQCFWKWWNMYSNLC